MLDDLPASEPMIRLAFFCGVLIPMIAWEWVAPCRRAELSKTLRWGSNLGILALDTVLVRLTFPLVTVGFAVLAQQRGWGLLNLVEVPAWLSFILALLALDLAVYLQHALFHAVPLLWRIHRVHHADLELDVTTGLRFHPIEILLSMGLKLALVAALGPPALAVLAFEVLLNATSMFNHANVRLPRWLDRRLRWFVVTPNMHRIHHSVRPSETNSNFGFNLPWWDRLLGTYRDQPRDAYERMILGVDGLRSVADLRLDRMLWQPLRAVRRP